jgi:hypothetical protein
MGKNKKDKISKRKSDDYEEDQEISDFERLKAYAEKKGKNIWEVSLKNIDEEEQEEEESQEEQSHDEESLQSEEQGLKKETIVEKEITEEINQTKTIAEIHADDKANEINIQSENTENIQVTFEDKIDLQFEKLKLEDKKSEIIDYPVVVEINEDIIKTIHIDNEHEDNNKLDQKGNTFVKFGNKKIIFEYPKEDTNPNPPESKKKKNKKSDAETKQVEKQEKKKKKKEIEDEIDEETLQRLEEAKRKREEFAYLEMCRIEEEEQRRKEDDAKKLLEDPKKKNDKNKYKPKPKKKKGK